MAFIIYRWIVSTKIDWIMFYISVIYQEQNYIILTSLIKSFVDISITIYEILIWKLHTNNNKGVFKISEIVWSE